MILLFNLFSKPRQTILEKSYSDFMYAVENNKVVEVETQGRNIAWKDTDGKASRPTHPKT